VNNKLGKNYRQRFDENSSETVTARFVHHVCDNGFLVRLFPGWVARKKDGKEPHIKLMSTNRPGFFACPQIRECGTQCVRRYLNYLDYGTVGLLRSVSVTSSPSTGNCSPLVLT
jgi:hypothetical protein